MSGLEQLAHRFPIVPPVLLMAVLTLMFSWAQPASVRMFPGIVAAPIGIFTLYNYYQYRKGNRAPLLRTAFGSAIILLTLLALLIFTWLVNR